MRLSFSRGLVRLACSHSSSSAETPTAGGQKEPPSHTRRQRTDPEQRSNSYSRLFPGHTPRAQKDPM